MKLSECTMGILVYTESPNGDVSSVGMVVGITNNCESENYSRRSHPERAIPLVKFSGETGPRGIHHSNLKPFKG